MRKRWIDAAFLMEEGPDASGCQCVMSLQTRLITRAGNRVRTDDLLITNQLLYQLSYAGLSENRQKDHILALAATICFQNAMAKIYSQNSQRGDDNRPSRRTKADRDPIQGGFVTSPSARSVPHGSRRWPPLLTRPVVRRPTRRAAEISPEEFRQARLGFEAKMRHYAPRSIAFLGKRALSVMIDRPDAHWGLVPTEFAGTVAWLLPNPSGLNRGFTRAALVSAYQEFRIALDESKPA
jgi:hypothetical protein